MGTWGRGPALGLMVSVAVVGGVAPAAAQDAPQLFVVLDGKGYGHGVGLPQDGALAMGRAGASAADILATFYPGTTLGRRSGQVRAHLLETPRPSLVVAFPSGGAVHDGPGGSDAPGFPVTVEPGGSVRLALAGGRFQAEPLGGASAGPFPAPEPAPASAAPVAQAVPTTTTTVPSLLGLIPLPTAAPPTTAATVPPPSEPAAASDEPRTPTSDRALWAVPADGGVVAVADVGRRYRGRIEAANAGGALQLLNDLDVEVYLRGMGEVIDPSWPAAGLQAQAIVARTYALDAMADGRPLCSTQQCQVYLGEQAEYGAMNQAVVATRGQVLVHGGGLAEAVYSASAGGITATPEEGFGMREVEYPYLKPVTYSPGDPQPWQLRMPLAEFARRLGYRGTASTAIVSRAGPSGRPLEVRISGENGDLAVDGLRLFNTFSLRSTLYTLRLEGPDEASATDGGADLAAPNQRTGQSQVFEAGPAASDLGRRPWTAAALVLLAAYLTGLAAHRRASRAAAPTTGGAPPPYTTPPRSTAASPESRRWPRRRSGPEPPPDRRDGPG